MRFQRLLILAITLSSLSVGAQPSRPRLGLHITARQAFRKLLKSDPAIRSLYQKRAEGQGVPKHRNNATWRAYGASLGLSAGAQFAGLDSAAPGAEPIVRAVGIGLAGALLLGAGSKMVGDLRKVSQAKSRARVETLRELAGRGKLTAEQRQIFTKAGWIN